jgi:hypothetical protein
VFQLGRGLYRFPLASAGPAFRLDVPLNARSHVRSFALTERAPRVVFLGDLLRDEVDELFSVALDLDDGPVRVSTDLPMGPVVGDVLYFDFSPDSRWIVYMADAEHDDRLELFSIPVHGRGPPRRLNGPLAEVNGFVVRFLLRGERAFFTAVVERYPDQELLWAPIDASLPARSLSGPMVAGGWVKDFEATSDGTWAVYRADQETVGFPRLYSVLVDGGGPPVDLSAPHPQLRSASDFQLTPDERAVVFLAYDGIQLEEKDESSGVTIYKMKTSFRVVEEV